jgi:hypothetical protein
VKPLSRHPLAVEGRARARTWQAEKAGGMTRAQREQEERDRRGDLWRESYALAKERTQRQEKVRELELAGIRRGDLQARPGDVEGKRLFDERWRK